MLIRKPADLRHSDVTPKQFYLNRRRFLAAGSAIAGAWALPTPAGATMKLTNVTKSAYTVNEKITPLADITSYNNYYEFGTDKEEPSHNANTLRPSPWQVVVGGLVNKPKTYDLDAIMKIAPLEERIYRHRCVERWSIVVPWIGFPLAALLKEVDPNSQAKYVAFQTLLDKSRCRFGIAPASSCPIWKAYAWTKPCIRWRCSRSAFMARRYPTRMARPSGWWCHGSTVSRALNRL
jgi:methionine sulfoxide reductase catalytic subunit